ncbi:hypothetical protein RIF29_25634 [Crotalaria pallida]|uniref:Uncharacterized protein n=1 Tax=Crotalaria pallida TaxID=3830 RepID=A0AAN9EMQ5_CROPI
MAKDKMDKMAILLKKATESAVGGSSAAARQGSFNTPSAQSSKRTPSTSARQIAGDTVMVGTPFEITRDAEETSSDTHPVEKRRRVEKGKEVANAPHTGGDGSDGTLTIHPSNFFICGSTPAPDDFLRLVKSEADGCRRRRLSANERMNEAQLLAKHLLRATNVMLCLADSANEKQADDFAKQLDAERLAKEEDQKAKEEADKNLATALKKAEEEANHRLEAQSKAKGMRSKG